MQYHFQKKKYKSLVISFIVHGIILLALIYYTLLQLPQTDIPKSLEKKTPAPVSIQQRKPRQKRVLPYQSTTPLSDQEEDHNHPYGEQLEQFNTLENPYQEVLPPNELQQETAEEVIEENMPKITKQTAEGTFPLNEITATDFMRAFKAAVRQERPPEATNDAQAFIQQRLGRQWGQASYTGRVAQALNQSFRVNARTIRHNEFVNKRIRLDLTILKDGTPGDLGNQPLSGIPAVDKHLRHVVKEAHFPPIPQRFNQETYELSIAVQIVLRDGAIKFGRNFEVSER